MNEMRNRLKHSLHATAIQFKGSAPCKSTSNCPDLAYPQQSGNVNSSLRRAVVLDPASINTCSTAKPASKLHQLDYNSANPDSEVSIQLNKMNVSHIASSNLAPLSTTVLPTEGEDKETKGIHLDKRVGLFSSIGLLIGTIIGSGIFVSPKGVTVAVGSIGASLGVWLAGGLLSCLGAYCYAEMGCMLQDSGGDYAYVRLALGDCIGFLRLWTEVAVLTPCCQAVLGLAFAGYVIDIFSEHDCALADSQVMIYAHQFIAACCLSK
ncbi:unnamed protein product [Protopolystoma xenopodis]|uniref:Amino acid permease/ SLC12A domain-containing protein n=1 Tax=Protopolystoma xenopodis TaxID=117903 RepID=A0A448WUD9_9PLAT|nr:unnamed protein product [Protopolystoma xenopodis]